jgi:hypothetical protein
VTSLRRGCRRYKVGPGRVLAREKIQILVGDPPFYFPINDLGGGVSHVGYPAPHPQGNQLVTYPKAKPAWNIAPSSSRYAGPVGGHLHKWVTLLTTTYRVTGMCALTFGLPSPQGNPEVRPSHFGYPGDQTCHRPEQI